MPAFAVFSRLAMMTNSAEKICEVKKINYGIAAMALCLLTGCGSTAVTNETTVEPSASAVSSVKADAEYADMSEYNTYDEATEYRFIKTTLDHIKALEDSGETFVLFMGYDSCVYCNAAMPLVNDEAKKYGVDVYYVNAIEAVNDGSMDVHRDAIIDQYKDQLTLESDGSYSIQVPITAFYINGKLETFHIGFVDDFDPDAGLATDDENAEYLAIIDSGFQAVAK